MAISFLQRAFFPRRFFPRPQAVAGLGRRAVFYPSRPVAAWFLVVLAVAPTWAQDNDECANALALSYGESVEVDLSSATTDGASSCGSMDGTDRWYRFDAPRSEHAFLLGPERAGIEMSVHLACPATAANEIACGAAPLDSPGFFGLSFRPSEGQSYWLRVAHSAPQTEPYPMTLTPGGAIVGVVTDAEGTPLEGIEVNPGSTVESRLTDADGRYRLSGFSESPRLLFAGLHSPYIAEFYDNIPCPLLSCFGVGDLVAVAPGEEVTANFSLELGAAISGVVRDEMTGAPLANQSALIFELGADEPLFLAGQSTDENGFFRFEGLAAGSYAVRVGGSNGYLREFWDDKPCLLEACDAQDATPIEVADAEIVDGLELGLTRGLELSGTLRDSESGEVLPFEVLELRDLEGNVLELTATNFEGEYLFIELPAGNYLLNTAARRHVNEVWPDTRCDYFVNCPTEGVTPVVIAEASLTGVDFDLDLGGVLSTKILDEEFGVGIRFPRLHLYDAGGRLLDSVNGGLDGELVIEGLPTAEFRAIAFAGGAVYAAEVYEGIDCVSGPGSCPPVIEGTLIPIVEEETTEIEFSLVAVAPRCRPDLFTLCVNQGRFAVRVAWRTPDRSGQGVARPLDGIDDSGSFYFFDEENAEMVVKVLDACGEPFDRFWVFAAGLTNVEVELTVEDTVAGGTKTYLNPQGSAFLPIQDTEAFDTCADAVVGPPVVTPSALTSEMLDLLEIQRQAARRSQSQSVAGRMAVERAAAGAVSPLEKAECVPGETTLCLGVGGRFQVQASWETPDGASGTARAVPFLRDTGLLWFFDAANIEVIVKVLDACGDPFDRFWVFAGGLTNVAVQLRVTDTVTGEMRVYRNEQGESFLPIQDTDAFATCP